jgi:hypothetical protein
VSTVVLHHNFPFEMLFGSSPTLTHLRIFGCARFPLLKPYNSTPNCRPKLQSVCFLGMPQNIKAICAIMYLQRDCLKKLWFDVFKKIMKII